FSRVCGPVLSPRTCTMISPLRPTTVADTAQPLALQVSIAVCAIVMAMEALRSLWLSSCALAVELRAEARTQPNVSAPERSVDRNILLLPNCSHAMRQVRKYSGILGIKGDHAAKPAARLA